MAVEWTRLDVECLTSLYRKQPVLRNVRLKEDRDRNLKEIAYGKILQAVKHSNESILLDQMKKKFHTLRSQYLKENKLIRDSTKSGAGPCRYLQCQALAATTIAAKAAATTIAAHAQSSCLDCISPTKLAAKLLWCMCSPCRWVPFVSCKAELVSRSVCGPHGVGCLLSVARRS